MAQNRKLYNLLPSGSALPWVVNINGDIIEQDAENTPFLYWPDGVPCVEANAWMISLLARGLSRRNRGGTLGEYAKNISSLIRFCYSNKHNITDLSDNSFRLFINSLMSRDKQGNRDRSDNEVLKIGRKCIDFIVFIGNYHNDNALIGEKHCRINVSKREVKISRKRGKSIFRHYWHHDAFPSADPIKKRRPIANDVVYKLKEEIRNIADRPLRERRSLLIASLEQTGGRRYEVAHLRVSDIEKANQDSGSAPLLRMMTVKKGDDKPHYREVPVPRAFIQQAMKYMSTRRRIIRGVKKRLKSRGSTLEDHDYLFISHTTGKCLVVDTITTELNNLCRKAGIDHKPGHPHLFRHAYITQKLKAIILQFEIANKDEFRKALLNVEAFKLELQQWTGHSSLAALEGYIDLAFNELSHMDVVYDAVTFGSAVEIVKDRIAILKVDAESGDVSPRDLLEEIGSMLEALEDDIERSVKSSRPKG